MNLRLAELFFQTLHVHPEWLCHQILQAIAPDKFPSDWRISDTISSTTYFRNEHGDVLGTMDITDGVIVIKRKDKL